MAVSLGYHETLLSVSGASTSSELSPEERAAAGVTEALSERFGSWRGFERVEESVAFAFREISGS